jgi:hypothetical protein
MPHSEELSKKLPIDNTYCTYQVSHRPHVSHLSIQSQAHTPNIFYLTPQHLFSNLNSLLSQYFLLYVVTFSIALRIYRILFIRTSSSLEISVGCFQGSIKSQMLNQKYLVDRKHCILPKPLLISIIALHVIAKIFSDLSRKH